jgi:DNA-binding IclR family transcriptional regulator
MAEKLQRGIQSIEVGGRLLLALATGAARITLSDLARDAGMDASKAHRYLVSFCKLGLARQDAATGNYMLGPMAVQLGLAALQRSDPLREATAAAPDLVARIGHTVAIAAPGHLGPTVVRIEESVHPLHVNMHTGTVMSLLNTATGLVFSTWLPRATITRLLGQEAMRLHGARTARAAAGALLDEATRDVRRHGIARAVGRPIPGINAVSAPIFDFSGQIVLALTALGPSGMFDAAWDGEPARVVRECADAVTRRIGGVRPT